MSASPAFSHEESWLLLPWLANGRLGGAERARLEQHVRGCAECAREVAAERLWCSTLTEPERVTYAPGPSFRKLMERIDAEQPSRTVATATAAVRAIRVPAAWRPPGLAWAASYILCVGLGSFTALMAVCSYQGLASYRFTGIAWLLHTGWDAVHHLAGHPIIPFYRTSSLGCAICDPVIALWCFAGAPPVLSWFRRRAAVPVP